MAKITIDVVETEDKIIQAQDAVTKVVKVFTTNEVTQCKVLAWVAEKIAHEIGQGAVPAKD